MSEINIIPLAIDLVVSHIDEVEVLPGDRLLISFREPNGAIAPIRLVIPIEGLIRCRVAVNAVLSEHAISRICGTEVAIPPAA